MKMTNLFTDYYSFEQRRNNSAYLLMNKYGSYQLFEKVKIEPEEFHLNEMCGLRLIYSEVGKIKIKNSFGDDFGFIMRLENSHDQIFVLLNKSRSKIELFINDNKKQSKALIFHLVSDDELLNEVNLMRLRSFSLSYTEINFYNMS